MTAEFGLLTIDVRERNLETLDDIEETSLDFYATIRSVYQQDCSDHLRGVWA